MSLDRRHVLGGLGAGLAATAGIREAQARAGVPASEFGVRPDTAADQTSALQRAVDAASATGTPIHLPAGDYRLARLTLRSGTQILGVPGRTVLRHAGDGVFLGADGGRDIRIDGVTLDGARRPLGGGAHAGLIIARGVDRLAVGDCRFVASSGHGVSLESCGGRITHCEIDDVAHTGVFSLDGRGVEIANCHVHDCGNNGIQVWRSAAGEDASIVTGNRVERIRAAGGGSGQNGNGINVFRSGAVLVTANRVADCAFSAIRANAAHDCQMLGNSCARLGEVALYAEFGFEGAIVANNLVDGAAAGISITNFNEGGRLAVVQGNLIRNLSLRKDPEPRGFGIAVEADSLVAGNVVENAAGLGIGAGWGRFLRDVAVTGNTVRQARIGIGVSAAAGAGYALIANNMISGATEGGIRAMNLDRPLGRDLALTGEEAFRNIAVHGNVSL